MSERFGDYELLHKIATGGMAEIYLARHAASGGFARPVVVKRMLPQLAVRKDFVTMFLDEARLAANLSHPNVVQVFNLGEHDGSYFMAMELVDGPHLGSLFAHSLRQRRPLPIDLCVYICARAADGLDHAHNLKDPATGSALQIVHRDISPQNILVSRHGDVKVTDFGVAKATTHEAKTRTGIIKGKVSYMSPEQCLGERVDRRTDVFALGIVLYELLTRRRLFRDKSDLLVMQRITQEAVPPPSTLNPAVDQELDAICMKALARDRQTRYASAADLSEALDVWLALHGIADARARLARWMDEHAPDLGVSQAALEAPPAVPTEAPFVPVPTELLPEPTLAAAQGDRGHTIESPSSSSALPSARSTAVRPLDVTPEATIPNPPAGGSTSMPQDGGTLVTPPPFSSLQPLAAEPSTDEASDPRAPPVTRARAPLALEPTVPDAALAPATTEGGRSRLAAAVVGAALLALVVLGVLWKFAAPSDDAVLVGAPVGGEIGSGVEQTDPRDAPMPVDAGRRSATGLRDPQDTPTPPDAPVEDPPSAPVTIRLVVETTPAKVPIFLGDERFLGMSPLSVDVEPMKLARLLAHFPSGTESVEIALDENPTKVALKAHIPLTLRSSPSGASARITGPGFESGVDVTTPVAGNVKLEAGGTYLVTVSAAGHESEKISLVADGKMVESTVTLRRDRERTTSRPPPQRPVVVERPQPPADPGSGLVSVFSEPWTSVSVAGRSFPATPVVREKVKAGAHVVRVVRREFGINETLKVNVPKDGALKVIFVFEDAGDGKYKVKSKRVE